MFFLYLFYLLVSCLCICGMKILSYKPPRTAQVNARQDSRTRQRADPAEESERPVSQSDFCPRHSPRPLSLNPRSSPLILIGQSHVALFCSISSGAQRKGEIKPPNKKKNENHLCCVCVCVRNLNLQVQVNFHHSSISLLFKLWEM